MITVLSLATLVAQSPPELAKSSRVDDTQCREIEARWKLQNSQVELDQATKEVEDAGAAVKAAEAELTTAEQALAASSTMTSEALTEAKMRVERASSRKQSTQKRATSAHDWLAAARALAQAEGTLQLAEKELADAESALQKARGRGLAAAKQRKDSAESAVTAAGEHKASAESEVAAKKASSASSHEPVQACLRVQKVRDLPGFREHGLGEDLIKAVGEVVLDKATQAGWELLRDQLLRLARCGARQCRANSAAVMPKTVAALEHSRIQDVVAQPDGLIGAILEDWWTRITKEETELTLIPKVLVDMRWTELFKAWAHNGRQGLQSTARIVFQDALRRAAGVIQCNDLTSRAERALWVAAVCVSPASAAADEVRVRDAHKSAGTTEGSANNWSGFPEPHSSPSASPARDSGESWSECLESKAKMCPLGPGIDVLRAHASILEKASARQKPRDGMNLLFELVKLDRTDQQELVGWIQDVVVGALDEDWTRVTSGAVALVTAVIKRKEGKEGDTESARQADELRGLAKVVAFLAGVGRYAASYQEKDGEKAAKARKDAIADLVSRMAGRRERTRGVVVSLGGSFGLGASWRGELGRDRQEGRAFATPFHLGLGLGFDSYHKQERWRAFGLHGELSLIDLGQYVAFENKELQLKDPDLKAALAPSVKLGFRLALRQTPLFVAAVLGVNPFLRGERLNPAPTDPKTGNMTWSAGVMLGFYIPFLDFN